MALAFKAEGDPAPQGSKSARSYCGQTAKVCPHCHRPHLVSINMVEVSARLKPWRTAVEVKARFTAGASWQIWEGPVMVVVTFILKRPKAHYRTGKFADQLRDSAPPFPHATAGMDVDKLARAAMDAMTGVIYVDDRQVIELRSKKIYAGSVPLAYADHPGAYITVAPLTDGNDA